MNEREAARLCGKEVRLEASKANRVRMFVKRITISVLTMIQIQILLIEQEVLPQLFSKLQNRLLLKRKRV